MKVQAILLIALIAVSNTFGDDFFAKHRLVNRNIMEVMVQIEAEIKAGHPLDTVKGMLDNFKSAVNSEQIAHDDLYTDQKTECDGELSFRVSEVSDATSALRDATRLLTRANITKGKASAELGTTDDQLIQFKQHLELIQSVRRAQQENFSRNALIFNDAIRGLEDAVDLAKGLLNGGSFVQLADQTGAMMKHAVSLQKTGAYAAVLASLAKLSLSQQNADESDVERLISLLNNLTVQLKDAQAVWVNENNDSIQMFNAQKERIENNITRLFKATESLKEQISNLNGVIGQQTAIAQAASNKKSRNQKLLDDATALCGSFEAEYTAATAGRRQELVIISELERMVTRRMQQV